MEKARDRLTAHNNNRLLEPPRCRGLGEFVSARAHFLQTRPDDARLCSPALRHQYSAPSQYYKLRPYSAAVLGSEELRMRDLVVPVAVNERQEVVGVVLVAENWEVRNRNYVLRHLKETIRPAAGSAPLTARPSESKEAYPGRGGLMTESSARFQIGVQEFPHSSLNAFLRPAVRPAMRPKPRGGVAEQASSLPTRNSRCASRFFQT